MSELQHSGRGGGEAVILVHNSIEISSPFRSSDAHPVHLKQYFHLMEHYTNRINLIRGPTHFIVCYVTQSVVTALMYPCYRTCSVLLCFPRICADLTLPECAQNGSSSLPEIENPSPCKWYQ